MTTNIGTYTASLNRIVGLAFGAIYVLIGLVGFAITTDTGFMATTGPELILFELNPLHNIVHLAVGAALAGAAMKGTAVSSAVNMTVGGVYGVVAVAGFALVGTELNLIALNHADNFLHLASAAVLLGAGLTRK